MEGYKWGDLNGMASVSCTKSSAPAVRRCCSFTAWRVTGSPWMVSSDISAALVAVRVPTLFVGSSRPFFDVAEITRVRPDWYLGRTVGAGHIHNVFVADQVNAMIEAFLARIKAGHPAAPEADYMLSH